MPKLTSLDHLDNMVIALSRLTYYVYGLNEKQFDDDIKTQDAVHRCIEIFAKSSASLPKELTRKYPKVFWAYINMLNIENCFGCDDLWGILHDENTGILKYLSSIIRIFKIENGDIKFNHPEQDSYSTPKQQHSESDLNLTRDYRYPIVTKHSIWTVNKK